MASYHKIGGEIRDNLEDMRDKLVEIRTLVSRVVDDLVEIARINLVFSMLEEQAMKLQLDQLESNFNSVKESISSTIGNSLYIGGSIISIGMAVANPVMIVPYLVMEG